MPGGWFARHEGVAVPRPVHHPNHRPHQTVVAQQIPIRRHPQKRLITIRNQKLRSHTPPSHKPLAIASTPTGIATLPMGEHGLPTASKRRGRFHPPPWGRWPEAGGGRGGAVARLTLSALRTALNVVACTCDRRPPQSQQRKALPVTAPPKGEHQTRQVAGFHHLSRRHFMAPGVSPPGETSSCRISSGSRGGGRESNPPGHFRTPNGVEDHGAHQALIRLPRARRLPVAGCKTTGVPHGRWDPVWDLCVSPVPAP